MYGSKFLLPIFVCLFIAGFSRAQNWEWAKTSVGAAYESINAIGVDQTDRTTYGVGEIAGLGSYPQITLNYGNEDAFVIKYDANGNVLWAFPIGGPSKDEATGIEVDQATGNIYVTGYIRRAGTVNFAGAIAGAASTITGGGGNNDAFVACYTKNGALLWYKLVGGNNDDRGLDVTVNASGVYVIGYYNGSASYGSVNTVLTNGSINYFVAAYNPTNGTFLWGNEMGSSIDDFLFSANATAHERRGCGITADASGVYIINLFGGLNYGIYHEGGSIPIALIDLTLSPEDIVVSSFSNAGIFNWATLYDNNSGFCSGVDITNDCNGIYATGSMSNNSVSPGGTTISSTTDNAFISRLSKASGNEIWIRQLNSNLVNGDYFMGIQADGYGNVYAAGMMEGTSVQMEISPAVHTEVGAPVRETIIVKYGTDGTFKSFERLPSADGIGGWATDIAILGFDKLLLGGFYDEKISFGAIDAPENDENGFVALKSVEKGFTYTSGAGNNTFCISEPNPTPTLNISGTGTFSGPAQVVFANTTSGVINLWASTPGGPYTITYSIPVAGCKAFTGTYDIFISPQGNASFSFATSNFCLGGTNPTPTVTTPGGTFTSTPGLVFVNTTTGQLDLTNSLAGNYTITYTTGTPCPGSSTYSITIQAPPNPSFSYPSNIYCSANSNPTATVTTAGGNFTSTAGLVFVSTTTGQINLATSTPGTYTITYTTGGLCSSSSTFTMTIVATDNASFNYAASSFCQADANPSPSSITTAGGTFSAPAGLVFVSTSTGEIDLAASTAGNYTITYTTSGICPASSTFTITIFAEEDPTFSYASAAYCQTDANPTPTTALAGGTFSSTAGLVFVNATTGEIDLANSTPGTYTINYTTAGPNCANSSTFSLTINSFDDPAFSYAASSFCQADATPSPSSITTAGGTFSAPAGLVFVSTSTGEIDLAASTAGNYAITYTTSGICPASSTFAITIFAEEDPTFSYASAAYCPTDANPTPATALAGGTFSSTAGLVFVNATTGEIDLANSTPGTYTINYTTAGPNCVNSSTFSLTINSFDDPAFSYAASSFCQADANPSPSSITTAGGTFSAPAGLVFVSTSTGEIDLAASTAGNYTITYTTSGICPASSTFSITIFAEEDPTFSYASAAYCPTDANPTPTTVLAGGTFSSTAGLVFVNVTTGEIDLANSTPGTYTINYTTAGPNCANSSTFSLTINSLDDPAFNYAASSFCQADANPSPSSITTAGGTFSAPAGLVFVSTSTGEINLAASTAGNYTITYTTSGVCPASNTFSITIFAEEDPTFSYASAAYCPTDANPTPTTALAGGTFSSTAGLVFVNATTGEIDLANSTPETYTINYTTAGPNCANSSTFSLTINSLDIISLSYSSAFYCESEANQAPIFSPPGGTFTTSAGMYLVSTTTGEISPALSVQEQEHIIKYSSNGICPSTEQTSVTIFTAPTAKAGDDQTLPFLFSTQMDASVPVIGVGTWSTDNYDLIIESSSDAKSTVKNLPTGKTELTWSVSNGTCPVASDKVIITVEDLWIPQALTPNNDGDNDFFALKSVDDVTCDLQLFNRWGQIVYYSSNYKNEWQGQNMSGDIQPNDTYFYVILIDGKLSYNGYVILKK